MTILEGNLEVQEAVGRKDDPTCNMISPKEELLEHENVFKLLDFIDTPQIDWCFYVLNPCLMVLISNLGTKVIRI